MILTLLAISLNDKPLSQPIMARFDSAGGSIGRADHNTLALPDPERFISRQQAEVVATGDGYLIRNTGVTNRIQVGGRAVPSGETARLQHGDQIRIAGYLLQVECHALDDSREDESSLNARLRAARLMTVSAETSTAPPAPLPPPLLATAFTGLSSDNPFADLLGPSTSRQVDPFADLLGPLSNSPSAPVPTPGPGPVPQGSPFLSSPSGVDPRSAAFAAPPPPPPANRLPADFDPFGAPARTPPSPPNATPVDPFAGLMPDSAVPSIDDAFGMADSDNHSADPLADFMADLAAPA